MLLSDFSKNFDFKIKVLSVFLIDYRKKKREVPVVPKTSIKITSTKLYFQIINYFIRIYLEPINIFIMTKT